VLRLLHWSQLLPLLVVAAGCSSRSSRLLICKMLKSCAWVCCIPLCGTVGCLGCAGRRRCSRFSSLLSLVLATACFLLSSQPLSLSEQLSS
jgi:hypothetical protein